MRRPLGSWGTLVESVAPADGVAIEIAGLTKSFGKDRAVDELSLQVAEGELLVLLGPSGCGKTTIMRSIAGLETPDAGSIAVSGRVVFDAQRRVDVPANRRNVALVFQSYAIWPHMTVFENVAFPLRVRRIPRAETKRRVRQILELYDLDEFADRGASKLSGGQMQRVAVARSVIMEPRALLLDEPLSNLDAKLRDRLRVELRLIQQQLGITSIYVTHDQGEALALADRVAVMRSGKIVQLDTPIAVYNKPRTRFVADFVGDSNLFPATVVGAERGKVRVRLDGTRIELDAAGNAPPQERTWVCIRPQHLEAGDGTNAFRTTVTVSLFMGDHVAYELAAEDGPTLHMVTGPTHAPLAAGSPLTVRVASERVLLVDE